MTARYCSLAQAPAPAFAPGPVAERLSALASGRRMWVNGTVLHHRFFDGDCDASVIPVPGRVMTSPAGTTGALRATPRSAPGSSRAAATSSASACTPSGCRRDGGDVLVTARIRRADT
ncbi:hypothetical protein AB0E85_24900 [Streptomyces sp. NPDC029044]|uniref:hypothetical protein n=1 Tax=Streptomyces sp. NPDC029044 TaxID=3157198 RepID=UPI0033EF9985